MAELGFHKKRRAVTRASVTKLSTKLTELEANPTSPTLSQSAASLAERLKSLQKDFQNHQLAIIDRTDDEQDLINEQESLDEADDLYLELDVRIQRLLTLTSEDKQVARVASKQLTLLQTKLELCDAESSDLSDSDEDIACVLEEYKDQVTGVKTELAAIKTTLLASDIPTDDPIIQDHTRVEKLAFDCLLKIKRRIRTNVPSVPKTSEATATRLPKLELPTFHGDILTWKNFWEQFCVSVHDRSSIPREEKLMYLQNAIKDKTAKSLIAGLTKSSEHYDEAVKVLQERYNRPRQIHQIHVRRIVEAPSLKDGSGKEIRALHDLVVQHLRALKSLGHEPSQAFITSLLEMKLDPVTMFEWQRHTQDCVDVPDYSKLLDFLNLRAQAAEASTEKRRVSKPISSMVATTSPADSCISCGLEKHQLYTCSKFCSLSHPEKINLLRSNNYCLNCLRPGHFVKKCKSLNHCKHCQ